MSETVEKTRGRHKGMAFGEQLRRRREEMRRKREEMKAHNVLMHDLALVSKQEEKDKVKTQVATAPS